MSSLFVPKNGGPKHQAVVLYPGLGAFMTKAVPTNLLPLTGLDFIIKSGRVLVVPLWKGSGERYDGFLGLTGQRYLQTFRQRMHEWRQETGQLLDYLATRADVDGDRVAWAGVSFGSSTMLPVLAMEPRFKAATLQLAGLPYRDLLPEVDPVNFVSRIKIPGVDAGGPLRSPLSARVVAAADVHAARNARGPETLGAVRCRARAAAARTGNPRNARVAGQVPRADGHLELTNDHTTIAGRQNLRRVGSRGCFLRATT